MSAVLKVDFHTHTQDDPFDVIPYSAFELIDRAALLGYDALAITLHDCQTHSPSYVGYAGERGIALIPGVERTIEGKHVLLINFSGAGVEGVRSFADLARLKERERGLVIAPHPYFPLPSCLGRQLAMHETLFDAVEYNGMFTARVNFNDRARRWALSRGKPMVGNGDVHRLEQLGTTYSLVDAEPDADAICDAVRAGKVRVKARPHSALTAARIMADLFSQDLRRLGWPRQPVPARERA